MLEKVIVAGVLIVFFIVFATLLRMGKCTSFIAGIQNVPEADREKIAKGFSIVMYLIALCFVPLLIGTALKIEALEKVAFISILVVVIGAVAVANIKKGKKNG